MAGCVRQILQIFHGRMGNLKQLATENDHRAHEHVPRRLKPQSPAQPGHAPALPGALFSAWLTVLEQDHISIHYSIQNIIHFFKLFF